VAARELLITASGKRPAGDPVDAGWPTPQCASPHVTTTPPKGLPDNHTLHGLQHDRFSWTI
jgi:hypothetical protein